MSPIRQPNMTLSPLLSFEETRKAHLERFSKTTPDQRVEWLGHMLEVMQLAHEARIREANRDASSRSNTTDHRD